MVRSILIYGHKAIQVFGENKKFVRYDFLYDYGYVILGFLNLSTSIFSIY